MPAGCSFIPSHSESATEPIHCIFQQLSLADCWPWTASNACECKHVNAKHLPTDFNVVVVWLCLDGESQEDGCQQGHSAGWGIPAHSWSPLLWCRLQGHAQQAAVQGQPAGAAGCFCARSPPLLQASYFHMSLLRTMVLQTQATNRAASSTPIMFCLSVSCPQCCLSLCLSVVYVFVHSHVIIIVTQLYALLHYTRHLRLQGRGIPT